jgi:hypothetical protein
MQTDQLFNCLKKCPNEQTAKSVINKFILFKEGKLQKQLASSKKHRNENSLLKNAIRK